MAPVSDSNICKRLKARDYEWFYTVVGQESVRALRPRLAVTQQDELDTALAQRDYSTLHGILEPVVCQDYQDEEYDHPKKEVPSWLVPAAIGLLLLLLLWLLLASCMDDWNRAAKDDPAPSPTATETVSPSPAAPASFSVYFIPGSADLDEQDRATLKAAIEEIEKSDATVTVVGTTDGTGSKELNAALAKARAESVQAELVTEGVDPEQITLEAKPQAVTDDSDQARRVDVVVVHGR